MKLPEDNEFSSGWVYGRTDEIPGEPKSALVRVELNGGGYGTSLLAAELYGLRKRMSASATTITYGWTEEGKEREHAFQVPAGAATATSQVPTGKTIRDRFVRMEK